MIFARKVNKIPGFYMISARKKTEFYIIILLPEKYFPIFVGRGGTCPCPPPPTPMRLSAQLETQGVS